MAEPKGLAALLLGSAADGDDDEPETDELDDTSSGGEKEDALRDFFSRGKAGDFKGAAEAFQRAYDLCAMGADEEPEELELDDDAETDELEGF